MIYSSFEWKVLGIGGVHFGARGGSSVCSGGVETGTRSCGCGLTFCQFAVFSRWRIVVL